MTPEERVSERLRLGVICLTISVAMFLQRPGEITSDTKSDLAFAPARFLGRALHLWEPLGQFGQLQNQAYGYLFPMGPFFLLGDLLQVPAWAIQRAWLSAIFCAAFLGAALLARRLGIHSFLACVVAGLAYGLSPRMLGVMGSISIEGLPTALAPWVLLPLVTAGQTGRLRQGAARSGLAVFAMGGVNAAATIAGALPAVVWLFAHTRSGSGRRLAGWWLLAATVASLWWVVPLGILGRYSPPFINWVEYAGVTTRTTSIVETLRGTDDWIGKLATSNGAIWPSAYMLNTRHWLVAATVLVAALGLGGLAGRAMPARRPLVLMLLVGVVAVSVAYVGPGTGPLAPHAREALDGLLAPFRNVHKFDDAVRLPIALGLAHLVDRVRERLPGRWSVWSAGTRPRSAAVASLAFVAIAATAWTPASGNLIHSSGVTDVPDYWRATAQYLQTQRGRSLVYPGMSTSVFVWGASRDEPLGYLGDVSWATRDQVPLSSAGNIRWLDAVQSRLDSGLGSPGLAASLARAGVSRIVVRNDTDWVRAGTPRPAIVHQAISRTPGLRRIATFGPIVWALDDGSDISVDRGLERGYPAVEVFSVVSPSPVVRAVPLTGVIAVAGGPESELALDDAGLTASSPAAGATVLAGDPRAQALDVPRVAVTDGMRRREIDVGVTRDNASPTLAVDDPLRLGRPVRDYLPFDTAGHETVARYEGITGVTASSSGSDPGFFRRKTVDNLPFSAIDGDQTTVWTSAGNRALGQWWEVRFDKPQQVGAFTLQLAGSFGSPVTRVEISTEGGRSVTELGSDPSPQTVTAPDGTTRWLRITARHTADSTVGTSFGLREVRLPGVVAQRDLEMVRGPDAAKTAVVVAADIGRPRGCVQMETGEICSPDLMTPGEDSQGTFRQFTLGRAGTLRLAGSVVPAVGAARLLSPGRRLIAAQGSSESTDPAASAAAAVDGDPGTAWIADRAVGATLTVRWGPKRLVSGLSLTQSAGLAASVPTRLDVHVAGRSFDVLLSNGVVRFPPIKATRLRVVVTGAAVRRDVHLTDGAQQPLPIGISELTVLGAQDLQTSNRSDETFTQACGFGPDVIIDGQSVPTRVTGTIADIIAGHDLALNPCGAVPQLRAGRHTLAARSTAEFRVRSLSLVPANWATPPGTARRVHIKNWGVANRTVTVGEGESSLLVVDENFNDGWGAKLNGKPMRAIRVDGWMQAFVLPPGPGGQVALQFGPDTPYRLSLSALPLGLFALLLMRFGRPRAASRVTSTIPELRSRRLLLAGGATAIVLLGGWWGLAAVVIGGLLHLGATAAYGGSRYPIGALVVLPFVIAGTLVTIRPWGATQPAQLLGFWPQLGCLVALAALIWALALTRDGGQPEPWNDRSRDAGRSTNERATTAASSEPMIVRGSTNQSQPEKSESPVRE